MVNIEKYRIKPRLAEYKAPAVLREDPEWWQYGTDPLIWMLEKLNRPQQALFAAIHGAQTGEAAGSAAWDAFLHGDDVRFADIMDEMGLRGQAGQFDLLDIVGVAGELLLDPINLIGVGAIGKIGKAGKLGVAASKTEKTAALAKLGIKEAELTRMGLVAPGKLGERVMERAVELLGPEPLSHYLTVGFGKYRVGIPGTQYVAEQFVRAGKGIRRIPGVRDLFSTLPETLEEATRLALHDVAERSKAGANQFIAMLGRKVPKEWNRKLIDAIETGNSALLKGAPEGVQEAYEMGRWYSKYMPDIEALSGLATGKYGTEHIDDTLKAAGLSEDEIVDYFIHARTPDVTKYLNKYDVRYGKGAQRGIKKYLPHHASQLPRKLHGSINEINEHIAKEGLLILHPTGPLHALWNRGPQWRGLIEEGAQRMGRLNRGLIKEGSEEWDRLSQVMNRLNEALGTEGPAFVKNLFKEGEDGAFHFQKFKQFYREDFAEGLAIRMGRHYVARTVAETMDVIAKQPEWAIHLGKLPKELAETVGFKNIDIGKFEKYLTKEFADRLKNTIFKDEIANTLQKGLDLIFDPRETSAFLKGYRQVMSWFRASTILPFAGYHVANKFGNSWARWLGGTLDVRNDKIAAEIMWDIWRGNRKELAKKSYNLGGKTFTGEELMHHLMQNDVMTGGSLTWEVFAYGGKPGVSQVGDKARFRDLINPTSRKQLGSKVARIIEDEDRVAHFIGRLRHGDSVSVASLSTDKHLFRYSDLPDLLKGTKTAPGLERDFLIFSTWYHKNIGLTLQKMWEYPGRLSMPIKVRNAMRGIYGDPDSEYAVPHYLRDQFYLYLGKDAEGNAQFLDPEKYLPPLSAAKFFAGGMKGMGQQVGSMLVPPLKALFERGMGKEFFGEREIEGVPGERIPFMGGELAPIWAYAARNIRLLNTMNRILFPGADRPGGRLKAGQPGAREPGEYKTAVWREWGGVKLQKTKAQRNRYFEAVSPLGRIGLNVSKIQSKLAGDLSPKQRESFLNARTKLMWEKAQILTEMIEDGTDPWTGKQMQWEPPMPKTKDSPEGMRDVYVELYSTLQNLWFGNPAERGTLLVEQVPRLQPDELEQTYATMTKLKKDMLERDMQYAIKMKNRDVFDARVLLPIRDIIQRPEYYDRERRKPSDTTHIYDYPYEFRASLIQLWYKYLKQAYQAGLIDNQGVKVRLKTFRTKYEVDYR